MTRHKILIILMCCLSWWGGGHQAFSQGGGGDFNPPNPDEPATINYCRLKVSAEPAEAAYVSGSGKYTLNSGSIWVSTSANSNSEYTYNFLYWTLNGERTSYDQYFYFTPQKGTFELVAHYEKKEVVFEPANPQEPSATNAKHKYYLTLSSSIEGACSFSMASGVKHEEQSGIYVYAYLNEGYRFDYWKLNGSIVSYDQSCYLTMPSMNSTLVACVSEIPFDPENPMEPGSSGGGVKMGDVTGDGAVDVEDVVAIVNKILGTPPANFIEAAADINYDNKVDVEDVVAVVNMILQQ